MFYFKCLLQFPLFKITVGKYLISNPFTHLILFKCKYISRIGKSDDIRTLFHRIKHFINANVNVPL